MNCCNKEYYQYVDLGYGPELAIVAANYCPVCGTPIPVH